MKKKQLCYMAYSNVRCLMIDFTKAFNTVEHAHV